MKKEKEKNRMRCEDYEERILSGAGEPDDASLKAHLAECRGCRRLWSGHRAALGLKGVSLRRTARVDRHRLGRRLALVSATVAAALVVVLSQPSEREARFTEADVVWTVLWARQDAERLSDPSDPALQAFGPVASWVAPPGSRGRAPESPAVWHLYYPSK